MAFLPKDVQAGLDAARAAKLRKATRLRVAQGGHTVQVQTLGKTGFAVAADAPSLRGFVDLYDGADHLFQCLIVAAEADGDRMHYEFKRATAIHDTPPLDFARSPDAPVALIAKTGD
ncbi:MAG: hypothetical protein AAGF60_12020 [Pseudomonadota bacterium]